MQDQILTYELNVGVTVNINIVDFMQFSIDLSLTLNSFLLRTLNHLK